MSSRTSFGSAERRGTIASFAGGLAAAGALIISGSPASAAPGDICSVVLLQKAYDTSKQSTNYTLMSDQRSQLCDQEYNSLQEAHAQAELAGFDLGYAGFSIGGDGATQSSSGKWSISKTSFCTASSADMRTTFLSNFEDQVAHVAVKAWQECVKTSTENVLYLSYTPYSGGGGFDGTLYVTANQGQLGRTITGIPVGGDAPTSISCNIAGVIYKPSDVSPSKPIVIPTTGTGITCKKNGDQFVSIAFQTSQGVTDFVPLPSKSDVLSARLDDLANGISAAQGKIASLQSTLVGLSPVKLYQCPVSTQIVHPEGYNAWVTYGCLGQVTSSDHCSNYSWWPMSGGALTEKQLLCSPLSVYTKQ
jgi:hypothetical protein